jgi:nucleoside-diphosphate-sugar epimerase
VRALVTGANGFLGRHVVAALRNAGHEVRALIRPAANADALNQIGGVEIRRADLRSEPDLAPVLADIDAVIHLAAAMGGSDFTRFSETAMGTERLFDAMRHTPIRKLVLCSSFSVYDWLSAHGTVDEELPLAPFVYDNGGYATAKLWQERMATRAAASNDWQLTILRPGYIWGRGNELPPGSMGRELGSFHLVFAPRRQLPFTHVENCADCFRAALESDRAIGQTFNVVDGYDLTPWEFVGEALRRGGTTGVRVGIPYLALFALIQSVYSVARVVFGPQLKVPSLFLPSELAQLYRPLRYSTQRLQEVLAWRPPLDVKTCMQRTFGPTSAAT